MLKRESERVEFKRSSGDAIDAMKSVSGMLNKFGQGVIYFGVNNEGTPIKNTITDSSLRDISRAVYECIEPKITPSIDTVIIDDVEVIKLEFKGNEQPYSSKGVYYMRSADENRPISQKELIIILQSKYYEEPWEKESSGMTIEDIDDDTLLSFYNAARECDRLDIKEYDKENILVALELMKDGIINNAAFVLFGKNAKIELKLALYATNEKNKFLDLKVIRNNVYNLVNEGVNYILSHIDWSIKIGRRKREEIPEIPIDAIREIVVNSFAHAKYSGTPTHEVDIYPDVIEILNSGTFPEKYSPDDFVENKIASMKRNPLILDILFRCKDVEKAGTGFSRVNKLCHESKVEWSYEKLPYAFKFIFHRNNIFSKLNTNNLSYDEQQALKLISIKSNISIREIGNALGFSPRTAQRVVNKLKDRKYLERVGTKSGHWKITENNLKTDKD